MGSSVQMRGLGTRNRLRISLPDVCDCSYGHWMLIDAVAEQPSEVLMSPLVMLIIDGTKDTFQADGRGQIRHRGDGWRTLPCR
jgi:hypothetical protein